MNVFIRLREEQLEKAARSLSTQLSQMGISNDDFTKDALEYLRKSTSMHTLEERLAHGNPELLLRLHLLIQVLARRCLLEFASAPDRPLATLQTVGEGFVFDPSPMQQVAAYQLSKFAFIRYEGRHLLLETPMGFARLILHDRRVLDVIFSLAETEQAEDSRTLGQRVSVALAGEETSILWLLRAAGALDARSSVAGRPAGEDIALRQWEFHDLLFHSRSRMGRHDNQIGGNYRFRGDISPQPAVKPNPWRDGAIRLPTVDLRTITANDISLWHAMEWRQSVRDQGTQPLSLLQLSEFLFRVARVRSLVHTDLGDFTSRPYPSGGASYELELYVLIDRCHGVEAGFYYYDPVEHLLCRVSQPNEDTHMLLADAYTSNARTCWPQILIVVASRFARVSWKYSGIAYATQLKNLGALYASMYLVATSMGLAPCALGLGNSERFCRLTKTSPFVEASIGEFMLGSRRNVASR